MTPSPTRLAAGMVGLALSLGLAATACGNTSGTAASADPTLAPAAAPASDPTTTAPSALAAWWADNQDDFNAVLDDADTVGTDADNQDVSALGADCQTLADDVAALQADPAIPAAAVNTPFQAALRAYARGATECSAGADNSDSAELGAAAADLNTGNTQFKQADSALSAVAAGG